MSKSNVMFNIKMVDTIFLDMDGTLLDLHYDNFIWETAMPIEYANLHGVTCQHAKSIIKELIHIHRGTLNAYCLKYWSRLLNIDLVDLHYRYQDKITFRENAELFLQNIKDHNFNVFLVTNADKDNLRIKLSITFLDKYMKGIYSAHDFGHAKETQEFWLKLHNEIKFSKNKAILIDDNRNVLCSAKQFGLGNVFLISKPCSMTNGIYMSEYNIIDNFNQFYWN
ncbi:MAG: HAD family hydrolase [Pseudomonadota bacterium]